MKWKDHFNSFFKSNSGVGWSSTAKSVLISSNSPSNGPIERSLSHATSRNGPKMDVLPDATVNTERILDERITSTTTRLRQSHLVWTIFQRLAMLQ